MNKFLIYFLFSFISNFCCLFAEDTFKEDSVLDFTSPPDSINEFFLDLYEIRDSRITEILNKGICIFNKDSITGDYIELSVSNCSYGTIIKIEKKDWSLQTNENTSILGYCKYKEQIVLIIGEDASSFFKKSKKKKQSKVFQFEPSDLRDYNPPMFLLPQTRILEITSCGQLLPVIK